MSDYKNTHHQSGQTSDMTQPVTITYAHDEKSDKVISKTANLDFGSHRAHVFQSACHNGDLTMVDDPVFHAVTLKDLDTYQWWCFQDASMRGDNTIVEHILKYHMDIAKHSLRQAIYLAELHNRDGVLKLIKEFTQMGPGATGIGRQQQNASAIKYLKHNHEIYYEAVFPGTDDDRTTVLSYIEIAMRVGNISDMQILCNLYGNGLLSKSEILALDQQILRCLTAALSTGYHHMVWYICEYAHITKEELLAADTMNVLRLRHWDDNTDGVNMVASGE